MDILQSFTAKLDKNQLKDFLKEAIEKQHPGFKVTNVTFNMTTVYDQFDRGPGERVLSNVEVKLEKVKP